MILGMDWLIAHGVNLDYAPKRVTLRIERDNDVVVVEVWRDSLQCYLCPCG